jgi:hypothetical protein
LSQFFVSLGLCADILRIACILATRHGRKAVHERMGKLANRVTDPGRIFGQLHQRISEKEAQHCRVVNAIHELGADKELIDALVNEPMGKRERRIARAVLREARERSQ